jgi:hypothetical protein
MAKTLGGARISVSGHPPCEGEHECDSKDLDCRVRELGPWGLVVMGRKGMGWFRDQWLRGEGMAETLPKAWLLSSLCVC